MKRRIIAVLAAAALAATFGVGASPASADEPTPTGAAYVAIGDSIASGNGLLPYVDPVCLRSEKAYPSVLAGMLGTTVVSTACTGSPTSSVLEQAQKLAATGVLGGATQLVTITAGVNDLDWLRVLRECAAGPTQACLEAQGDAEAAVLAIPAKLAMVIGTVRAAAGGAHIVVTGYPELFGQFTGTCSIGSSNGSPVKFGVGEAAYVNGGVANVNLAVQGGILLYKQAFAAQFGFEDTNIEYVDVVPVFDDHSLCDSGERWISGLVNGKKTVDRGFHPNVSGQQAYARTIFEALMP